MTEDDKDLSQGARALVDAEKKVGAAPGKARVAARLEASLWGPGGNRGGNGGGGEGGRATEKPAPAAATARGVARSSRFLSHALAGVIGTVVGITATMALRKPDVVQLPGPVVSVYIEREKPGESVVAPNVVAPSVVAPSVGSSVASVAASSGAPPASATGNAGASPSGNVGARGVDTVAAERALLDPARTALGRGDGASALDGATKHERAFPSGQLAEEREAIAVQALVSLHRGAEARARGDRFLKKYPNSVLGPAVQTALATLP